MQSRIRRAKRIRPAVRNYLKSHSLQQLSEISEIPKSVLFDFAEMGKTPQERNLRKIEGWVEKEGLTPAEGSASPPGEERTPAPDLARQLDEIIRRPGDWMEKSFFVAELSAAYRARAMDTAERRAMLRERRRKEPEDTRPPTPVPIVNSEDEGERKAG